MFLFVLVTANLIKSAQDNGVKVKGAARMPTKTLRVTTRKTPCGQGRKTYDKFQMRIHKRVINMRCSSDVLRQITCINIDPAVEIDVTISEI